MLIQCISIELLSTYFNASTQCDVGLVCVPIELLSTYFNVPQRSVMLIQCVSPWSYCPHGAIVPMELLSTYFNVPQRNVMLIQCVSPWSYCPHGAIVNILQCAPTQCDVGPVCVSIELLTPYFNLPQSSVVLVQCVSP